MLRPFTQINIQQVPTQKWGSRNLNFNLDFVTEYSIETGWEKHTDTCKIRFPKNISLFGSPDGIFTYNSTYNLILGASGTDNSPNIDASGQLQSNAPLIMKGDVITINHGYIFRNNNDIDNYVCTGQPQLPFSSSISKNNKISSPIKNNLFFGYVSSVGSGTPIEIECEDNFYLLKRTPFDKSIWNQKESDGNTSLYNLMQHILDLTNKQFSLNEDLYFQIPSNDGITLYANPYPELTLLNIPDSITAQFSLGYLEIGDMTCGQLLDKLKQQYHFESTFRGNVLQFAFPIYIDSNSQYANLNANSNNFFCFRDIFNSNGELIASANIFPSHDLEYSNKDDIVLSATVQCKVQNSIRGKSTLSGAQKTKVEKLKVYVYWDIPSQSFKSINLSQGQVSNTQTPPNIDGGERHEFWYPVDKKNPNPTIGQLTELGIKHLEKYHYTGFRGCFSTFAFPYVQWNDNANILDPIYADRNGQYKIKKVIYKGGMKGLSQDIYLDYKINSKSNNQSTQSIFML